MSSGDFPLGIIDENPYINNRKIVEKPWGREIWLELNDKYCYKRIEIKAGFKTSYQIHNFKKETNYIIQGNAEVWLENDSGIVEKFFMKEGDFFTVVPARKHRVIAITDIILQEVSTPEVDDVIRINDEFNRSNGRIEEEHILKPVVCIIAAGTGSRLGEISKNCHKTLIPYNHKAVLTNIIERFKPDIEIVIAVGHLKEQIIEYIDFYHPERNIKFIEVDPYIGPGSGPAYSLECCRSVLQKPFYFCVSDFCTDTFLQNETLSTENWIGLSETKTPEIYSTVEISDEIVVKQLINKTPNGFSHAFTGIFYMYDYKLFWKSFDEFVDERKEVVDIFKNIQSFQFKIKNINWYDVGTLELYNDFIDKFEGKNLYLHNTKFEYKYKKGNEFIKKTESTQKITNLFERAEFLKPYIPKMLKKGKFFFSYEYVQGKTLYQLNDKNVYLKFFNWFGEKFCQGQLSTSSIIDKNAELFYFKKTLSRLELFKDNHKNFEFLDNIKSINETPVLPMQSYLDMVDWDSLSRIIYTPLFHGDLQFDNIISTPDGDFKLIDWREDFGGNVTCGDLYYDLAKLYGGIELNYNALKDSNNYFTLIDNDLNGNDECLITHHRDDVLKTIQDNEFNGFLTKNKFDVKRVKLLTAIIFLNMAPLHINNFDIFLFFKSKLLFNEIQKYT